MLAGQTLWDIEAVSHPRHRHDYAVVTSAVRVLRLAGSVVLLWLLSAAVADAAPTPRRGAVGPVCDAQTLTPKAPRRALKSFVGSLKAAKRRAVRISTDTAARIGHGPRVHRFADGAIIQDAAPAARADAGDCLVPSLRSLGVLIGAVDMRRLSRTFSPRSPRGPPLAA
jgi:hypothetical protein